MTRARATIAVVDDDIGMLESLEDLLESSGYETTGFSSAQALLAAGLRPFDLVIADIGMPSMDGFALRDIALKERPELPMFLITGRQELADRGRARGIDRVFRKPFDAPLLLAAIEQALRPSDDGGDP